MMGYPVWVITSIMVGYMYGANPINKLYTSLAVDRSIWLNRVQNMISAEEIYESLITM